MRSLLRSSLRTLCRPTWFHNSACYSTVNKEPVTEQVRVNTRSNGFITLDIYRQHSSSFDTEPVLLYLPSSSHLLQHQSNHFCEDDGISASQLSILSGATVVKINYRLSKDFTYPTPVHDVAAGLEWVAQHFFASDAVSAGALPGPVKPSLIRNGIGIYGNFLGGSLATMLALTECRLSSTIKLTTAVLQNPILDWTAFDSELVNLQAWKAHENGIIGNGVIEAKSSVKDRRRSKRPLDQATPFPENEEADLKVLVSLRKQIFQPLRPATYFDPFASPMLFLRTEGVPIPAALPDKTPRESTQLSLADFDDELHSSTDSENELDQKFAELMGLEAERARESGLAESSNLRTIEDKALVTNIVRQPTGRKYLRSYPPADWGEIAFPKMRISCAVNEGSILQRQSLEFTTLLRRALLRSRLGPLPTRRQLERRFSFLNPGGSPGMELGLGAPWYMNEEWIHKEKERFRLLRAEKSISLSEEVDELVRLERRWEDAEIGHWLGQTLRDRV